MTTPIHIREHVPGGDVADFLRAAQLVYRNDPSWVPPLNMEIRDRLNPKRNPFFEHGEAALFTAWRGEELLGRCSASIDREHLRVHKDDVGFFGFFDTVEDPEVAQALIDRAERWLAQRGMKTMRGPLSLSINEEVGLVIEGFEHPPVIMTPHSRPYQATMAEAAGLTKAKDLLAWRYEAGHIPPRAQRAWEEISAMPEVRFRSVDRSKMKRDLDLILEVFNDAWCDNWGFVPATEAEARKTAKDLRLVIEEQLAFVAEIHGRVMGICVCLPNLNEVIRDFGGKLSPVNVAKLLWRLKVKHPGSARLLMLGIRKELRGVKRYGGLSTAMYVELAKRGPKLGYNWGELSWTLEDNRPVNLGIRAMGGSVYKKMRVFEKPIANAAPMQTSAAPMQTSAAPMQNGGVA